MNFSWAKKTFEKWLIIDMRNSGPLFTNSFLINTTKLKFERITSATRVPFPLGCRGPPGFDDVGAVVVGGVVCDVGMIVSMP